MPRTEPDRQRIGAGVEDAARAFLLARGWHEVARNARLRVGELDLVMLDGDTLVFVEVRFRRSDAFGSGAESVDWRKQRKLVRAAEGFLQRHREHALRGCRFDVVSASGDPGAPRLEWIRDAFRADDC